MKQMMKNRPVKAAIFILAVLMLLFSGVQTARAIPSIRSNYYYAETEMKSIGISLVENGNIVTELLKGPLKVKNPNGKDVTEAEKEFRYGVTYAENLAVQNSGSIDEYARVIVTRYWLSEDGTQKDPAMDPELIKLHPTGNWIPGGTSDSGEQLVFYYPGILPAGAASSDFIDAFQVDGSLADKTKTVERDENGRIVITFEYDGRSFVIAAEAQCVQTHNADLAINSAWGADAARILAPYITDGDSTGGGTGTEVLEG